MKRFFVVWLTLCLLLGLALYFGRETLMDLLRQKIETTAETAGIQLRIGHLGLSFLPFVFKVENASLDIPLLMKGKLQEFEFTPVLSRVLERRLDFNIRLRDGQFQWMILEGVEVARTGGTSGSSASPLKSGWVVGGNVLVENFELRLIRGKNPAEGLKVERLEVALPIISEGQTAMKIDFLGEAEALGLNIPIQVRVPQLQIAKERFQGQKISAAVLGLTSEWNAEGKLDGSEVKVDGQLRIADLRTLPKTAVVKGVKELAGSLEAEVHANLLKDQPPSVTAKIHSPSFSAHLNLGEGNQKKINGPVEGQIAVDVSYVGKRLHVSRSRLQLGFQNSEMLVSPYFQKAAGTPFSIEGEAEGDQDKLSIPHLDVRLANASFSNRLVVTEVLKNPQIEFETELAKVDLAPLGKLVPMFNQFPVVGQMAAKISGNVPANNPKAGRILVQRFHLGNVRGTVDLQKPTFRAKGPFRLNLEASSLIQSGAVKKLEMSGELSHDPVDVRFVGTVKNMQEFVGQFVGKIASIEKLTKMLPGFSGPEARGNADFRMQILGPLELSRPPMEWGLKSNGSIRLHLSKVEMPKSAPTPSASASSAVKKLEEVQPFLEMHRLYEGLHLALACEIGELQMDRLTIREIAIRSQVSAQGLRGELKIAQIFGGNFALKDFSINPFRTKGFFAGEMSFAKLNLTSVLQFLKPDFAQVVSGNAGGQLNVKAHDPRRDDFMAELRAEGRMTLAQARLKTLPLVEMADGFLSKIPGAQQRAKAQAKDVSMTARLDFSIANKVLILKPFEAVTERRDELNLNGTVSLDMAASLHGDFKLAQPPVGGSFLAANQDEKGRLVLPLEIDGSLLSPKVAFLGSTLDKMVRNTLEYEKKKAIKQATESIQKKVEDEVTKKLKGIFGQ